MIDNHSRLESVKKAKIFWNLTLCHHVLLYALWHSCDFCWPRIGVYEVIDMPCSSQCYVGRNLVANVDIYIYLDYTPFVSAECTIE
jgi:hypothetical protein